MHVRPLLLITVVLAVAVSGVAHAQGPVYTAQTPTKGALYRDGPTDRYLLGGTWLYRPDLADTGIAQGFWRDTAATDGWAPVTVPNSYNAGNFTLASMAGWVGWYRKDFRLPRTGFPAGATPKDIDWIVRFESVNYRAEVWLNGKLIGTHAGAYLPFEFDLTGMRAGVNRLVVRVDNIRLPTDLPPGGTYAGGDTPVGGWWNFGGILQEVYLRAVDRVDINQVQVRPVLPCPTCAATIDEQVRLRNLTGVAQRVHLRGSYGSARVDFGAATVPARGTWTGKAEVPIKRPRLWAPVSPTLYRASLTLSSASGPLGGYVTYSGIRSIKVTGGRLELNGRLLNLRGVALHEASLAEGAALDPASLRRLVDWVRSLGATIIRQHYPLNPEIEEMADQYGLLIWSEVPVYQLNNQALATPSVIAQAHTILTQNILTNQNHPSILLWSIGNELPATATASESKYIAGATALAHRLDPTRPAGIAISDWPGLKCQPAYAPLDVIGVNDYFGWYDAGGGATADRSQLGPFLDSVRACYPKQALFISEFGFESNRDGPVEERGTYAFQSNSAAYHLSVFAQRPWLSGAIYFALQDFADHPGFGGGNPRPDPPFVQKGLFDLQGNPKPAFSVVAGIYKSTVQIAPPASTARGRVRRARTGNARASR